MLSLRHSISPLSGNPIARPVIMAEELCYLFMVLFLSPAPGMDVQSDSSSKANQPFVPGSMFHREILQG